LNGVPRAGVVDPAVADMTATPASADRRGFSSIIAIPIDLQLKP
jgi:hypothetical protein